MELKANGMKIEEILAAREEGKPPKLAGVLDAELTIDAPAKSIAAKVKGTQAPPLAEKWGMGKLSVNQGRLLNLPLLKAIQSALNLVGAGDDGSANDRLNFAADLSGDGASVTEFTLVSKLVAARGSGKLGLDRSLDLTINAGPIEKMQDILGSRVGGAIARVTDKLVSYRVTGKLGQPQVDVVVAGGSVNKVGDTLDRIGENIGNLVNPKDKGQ
jgi:hypothetical protein